MTPLSSLDRQTTQTDRPPSLKAVSIFTFDLSMPMHLAIVPLAREGHIRLFQDTVPDPVNHFSSSTEPMFSIVLVVSKIPFAVKR